MMKPIARPHKKLSLFGRHAVGAALLCLFGCAQQIAKGPTHDPDMTKVQFISYPSALSAQPDIQLQTLGADTIEKQLRLAIQELGYRDHLLSERPLPDGYELQTPLLYQLNDCKNEPHVVKIALQLTVRTGAHPTLACKYGLVWAGCKECCWRYDVYSRGFGEKLQKFRDAFLKKLGKALNSVIDD